jgi:hypothetical protein
VLLSEFSAYSSTQHRSAHRTHTVAGLNIDVMTSESRCTNPIAKELIATVASYGMAEIPTDLLASLEEIAVDLAEDDGTTWWVRSTPSYLPTRLAS